MTDNTDFLASLKKDFAEIIGRPKLPFHDSETRRKAFDRFIEGGLPTMRQEEWRFTNIVPLTSREFALDYGHSDDKINPSDLELPVFFQKKNPTIIFVDGRFRADLSSIEGLDENLTVEPIAEAADSLKKHYRRLIPESETTNPFVYLNDAFLSDGVFIHIAASAIIEKPIQIAWVSTTSEQVMTHVRNFIKAEQNSQCTIVEAWQGTADSTYWTNNVTEVMVAENAVVDHYRLQDESREAIHFTTLEAEVGRSGNFSSQSVSFGARVARNDIGYTMAGKGGFAMMNGLYQVNGNQLIDNHTRIDHAQPNCETHEYYKGILDGHSRGVFNGKIMVRRIAQKTNSKQTNRNLLLSPQALINTNPQLEIFADDVRCTHGATIGQLDDNQLYYLRSRGIDIDEARRMLVFAFANEVLDYFKLEPFRAELERRVLASQEIPDKVAAGAV